MRLFIYLFNLFWLAFFTCYEYGQRRIYVFIKKKREKKFRNFNYWDFKPLRARLLNLLGIYYHIYEDWGSGKVILCHFFRL